MNVVKIIVLILNKNKKIIIPTTFSFESFDYIIRHFMPSKPLQHNW